MGTEIKKEEGVLYNQCDKYPRQNCWKDIAVKFQAFRHIELLCFHIFNPKEGGSVGNVTEVSKYCALSCTPRLVSSIS